MTLGHSSWQAALAGLGEDAALAPFARAGAAFVWSLDGWSLLAANAAGEAAAAAAGPAFAEGARERLRLLGQGLAPETGVRLERLPLGGPFGAGLATCACRRLRLADGRAGVLIVAKPATAVAATGPQLAGRPQPQSPLEALRAIRRVLWETDGEDRIVSLSPEFAGLLAGAGAPSPLGQRWSELLGARLVDVGGGLAAATASRRTWSGQRLLLAFGSEGQGLPVELSASPILDAARGFAGYRGFGLVRAEELQKMPAAGHAAPSQPPGTLDEQLAEDEAESHARPDDAPDEDWREEAARHPPAPPTPETSAPSRPQGVEPRESRDGRNVVRLPLGPKERLQPVLAPAKPILTTAERSAFREIARALGARIEGEPPEPQTPDAPHDGAGSESQPAHAQAADEAASKLSVSELRGLSQTVAPDTYAELLDKLPIGVLVNRGDEAIYANRTLLDLLGYRDLAGLGGRGGVERLFRGRAPEEGNGAVMLIGADGASEPVDARLTSISWGGRPATLMAFRRALDSDATARAKALELDLRRSEGRLTELAAILDTATDGVVTLDDRGRILSLNKAAEALFGYDQREVTGESIAVLLAPESHVPALDYLEGLKGGGVASVLNDGREVLARVRQGGHVPLFMTMGRISDGAERKFCAVLRDITPWKTAETELTEARKAAERASAQKSDVLAKISHEIRTPLNAIIGFAEVMGEERFGPVGNERYKEYLQDIRNSGGYVISLVNDLLDLAKIEAGKLDLDFASVSLNDIATSTVALLQPEAARCRVVLRSGLSPKLPPVVADERSLRQIIINLLSNAVKFTDAGGQVIVSTALGDKGEAILRVRDTGIGMTDKELQLALEPFRQVSATRRGGGTGLGLPLTKALVEANRGAFVITSVKGEGTLAEVIFPPQRVLAS